MQPTDAVGSEGRRLGEMIREHRVSALLRTLSGAGALLGIGGAALILPLGLYRWYFAYSHFGPVVVWRWSLPYLASGLALAIVGAVGLSLYLSWRDLTVQTYTGGLLLGRGRSQEVIPWDEVRRVQTSAVRYGPPGLGWRSRTDLILETQDGRRLSLSYALEGIEELVETIKRSIYPRLLAEYTRAFNQGQPLTFGPLTLTAEGVYKGKESLSWAEVREARLDRGVFALEPASNGRELRVSAQTVPNIDVCLQFIQHLARGGT